LTATGIVQEHKLLHKHGKQKKPKTKYKLRFNTAAFPDRRRRDWEQQLMNDFAVALNGKEFLCDSKADLMNRLCFIAHVSFCYTDRDPMDVHNEYNEDPDNFITIEHERYGSHRLAYAMYGIPMGYVDVKEVTKKVEREGYAKIPFSRFYDIRQGNFFKNCFIEINRATE
jgi:hypothetical protein